MFCVSDFIYQYEVALFLSTYIEVPPTHDSTPRAARPDTHFHPLHSRHANTTEHTHPKQKHRCQKKGWVVRWAACGTVHWFCLYLITTTECSDKTFTSDIFLQLRVQAARILFLIFVDTF